MVAKQVLRRYEAVSPKTTGLSQHQVECVFVSVSVFTRQKLAAAAADRLIYLFDEAGDKRDRFRTKPADPEVPTGYLVWGMTFSPDAAKLAIAQVLIKSEHHLAVWHRIFD